MSYSNIKSFMVRSICATLIAVMLLTLLSMTAFASANSKNQRPSAQTIKSLAQRYLNERNRMLISSNPNSNYKLNVSMTKPSEMSQQLAARQSDDMEKIRAITKKVEDQGSYYWNRFDTKVEIEKTTVARNKTVARIYEYTRLYFTPQYVRPGSECSSFDGECDFTFVRNGAKWIISDVTVPNPGTMPPPNQPSVKPKTPSPKEFREVAPKQIVSPNAPRQGIGAVYGPFSGQAIVDYCNMYWSNYNSYWYPVFSADCQNFVSQALHYAGWPCVGTNPNAPGYWFCNKLGPGRFNWSNTWVNCSWWRTFAVGTTWGHNTNDYNGLRVGDVVQVDYNVPSNNTLDHSMIVSRNDAWDYRYKFLSAHTTNRHNWPLTSLLAAYSNSNHWYALTRTY